MSTKLYIKYMVSLRCKMMVKEELEKLGLHHEVLDLGMVQNFGRHHGETKKRTKSKPAKIGIGTPER